MNRIILYLGIFIVCTILGYWISSSIFGWIIDGEIRAATVVAFLGILATFYKINQNINTKKSQ